MKKPIFIFLGIAITVITAKSQHVFPQNEHIEHEHKKETHEHNGKLFSGGAVSFWHNAENRTTDFDLCPEIGYLFNDAWGVGLMLGYEREKKMENGIQLTSHAFKLSPFVRYYYYHNGPFNLYFDGGFGLNFATEKSGMEIEKQKGFEIGIRPGACVDLTEGLCLCLHMGFAGYRNRFFMGEEPRIGENGFGLQFTPEELRIGLELEF